MSSSKIQKLKSIFRANGSCRCRPKPIDIIQPKPKSKTSSSDHKSSDFPFSSASSSAKHGGGTSITADDNDCSSTTFSLNIDASPNCCPKIHDSFAIVKNSDDPYHDFRTSMLQMIFEKEIYSQNDLQQLLDCFLQLNSPQHHEVIVKAFIEIWNGSIAAADDGGKAKETELNVVV